MNKPMEQTTPLPVLSRYKNTLFREPEVIEQAPLALFHGAVKPESCPGGGEPVPPA